MRGRNRVGWRLILLILLPVGPAVSAESVLKGTAVPVAFQQRAARLANKTERLDPDLLALALQAFAWARVRTEVTRNILTVIDYRLSSVEKRLWVIDLDSEKVLFHELVAHGRNTGNRRAESFSNVPGSLMSSLGVFLTSETYRGRHGYSLRLDGLEPGINDRARERAIVLHGAAYVSRKFVKRHGRLGRSWGCPAVRPEVTQPLIDTISGGSVLFAYYPDPLFLQSAHYLNGTRAPRR